MPFFYLGLDLGRDRDYTALTLIEEGLWLGPEVDFEGWGVFVPPELEGAGWVYPSALSPKAAKQVFRINLQLGRPPDPPLFLRHLERYELGTSYGEVVARIKRLLNRGPMHHLHANTRFVVDYTGVGRGVVDWLRAEGLRLYAIDIHGGQEVKQIVRGEDDMTYRVPKRDLVAAVEVAIKTRRLQIAKQLQLTDVLIRELANFHYRIDPRTAHDSYSHWRENDHDDIVLSTAIALWYRAFINIPIEERNRSQGGYRIPEASLTNKVQPFFKSEPEPFFTGQPKPSGPNPWHGLTGGN